jgi:hypothetical protein
MTDELEAIRARHWVAGQYVTLALDAGQQAHTDRATLLRLLDAAREELRQQDDGWQDISTAPKDGTQILACALLSESLTAQGHVPDISVVKWDRDDWVAMADGYHAIKSQGDLWTSYHEPYVTHWQPLPPTRARGESS